MRSSSPVILNAASFYERPLAIDGEKGRGEVYEAVLSSRLFRISIKEATIHASAISKGKKYGEYLIDGRRCPPFGMEEILSILSSSGYKVLPSMKRDLEHILPVNNFQFSRDKDGMLGFYRGLCDLDLGNFNLTFGYKRRGEGEFALYSSFSEKEVDIGDLEALNLGIRTYGEVDERRRLKLIDYLKRLSFMLGEGSYDLFDLVDYYRIIDMMQTSDEDKDFSFTIVKRKVMRRDDGYVRTLTPFDFQYYRDGFTDSEEEREMFLMLITVSGVGANTARISSYTVRSLSSPPVCSSRPVFSPLLRTMRPASGSSSPSIRRRRVVFPSPFAPISPMRSPSETEKATSSNIVLSS